VIYDFNNILTQDNLLKKVSEYQIFKFYIPELTVGSAMKSPLRNDTKPSFSIYKYSNKLLYHDFSTKDSGDWIKFLKQLFNLRNLTDVLNKVNNDMQLNLYSTKYVKGNKVQLPHNVTVNNQKDSQITFTIRDFQEHDLKFWKQYGITKEVLIQSKTFPLQYYYINNGKTILADKYSYVYIFYEYNDILRVKIYQPYSKDWKWISNINNTVVDGIKELQYNTSTLIITKARKDRLVLNMLGYESVSTNNETSFIPEKVINKLKLRYSNIYIFFDNDETGIINSHEFSIKYELTEISIPPAWGIKDISDFVKIYSSKLASDLLTKLINNV